MTLQALESWLIKNSVADLIELNSIEQLAQLLWQISNQKGRSGHIHSDKLFKVK